MLELKLFGHPEIRRQGRPLADIQTGKGLALLAYLAVTGRPHSRSALAGLLWGGLSEAKARGNLTKTLGALRPLIEEYLTITHQTIAFDRHSDYWLDVAAFEMKVNDGSVALLQEAVQLYQGDFLDGFFVRNAPEFEAWVLTQQTGLKALGLQTLHTLVTYFANQGQAGWKTALDYANHLLRLEPWREEAHRQMMRLLALSGQRGAALAQFETCRQVLAEELGVEPEAETQRLYEQIRAGEVKVHQLNYGWPEAPEVSHFYGREEDLAKLEGWILQDRCRLIAVLGIGGVGKTTLTAKLTRSLADRVDAPFEQLLWRSLLNAPPLADLLPDLLRSLSLPKLIQIPDQLEQQLVLLLDYLRQKRCLLILDNLEGILKGGTRARAYRANYEDYEQLLLYLGQYEHQGCVLLTSRERPQGFARLARDGPLVRSLVLRGLSAQASQELLHQQGLVGNNELEAALIARYSGHPLALKLVAETIEELYFGDVGAFLAEEISIFADIRDVLDQQFGRLSPLEQEIMIWLAIERQPISVPDLGHKLLGLVHRPAYLEAIRALQGRNLIEKQGQGFTLQNVITEYVTERFINQLEQELASDMLETFNRYPLLMAQTRDYVRESQRRLVLQPLTERLVAQFGQVGLEKKLHGYLDRLRTDMPTGYAGGNILNWLHHLQSDLSKADFSGIAVWQANLKGIHLPDVNFSQADLSGASLTDTFDRILAVAFSPDGQLIAAGTSDGTVRLWRRADGQVLQTLFGHTGWVWSICFSPNGQTLASGDIKQIIHLWDVATGQSLKTLQGHTDWVMSVCFSPDGQILASGSYDQTVRLWDVATGEVLQIWDDLTGRVDSVCFSPDGLTLVSGSSDHAIRLWNVASGQTLHILPGHTEDVTSVRFSPNGQTLASGSYDQTVRLWDMATGEVLQVLNDHTDQVHSVCFSPDGQTLASGGLDQTIRLWDVASGRTIMDPGNWTRKIGINVL